MLPTVANCANTLIFTENIQQTLADDTEKENKQAGMHFLRLNYKNLSTLFLVGLEMCFLHYVISYI